MARNLLTVILGLLLFGHITACKTEHTQIYSTSSIPVFSGSAALPSGHTAEYETHYDRNSLNSAHVSESFIVASRKPARFCSLTDGQCV